MIKQQNELVEVGNFQVKTTLNAISNCISFNISHSVHNVYLRVQLKKEMHLVAIQKEHECKKRQSTGKLL